MAKKKRVSRGGGLSSLSMADLQREMSRRQGKVGGRLQRRRNKLAAKLAAMDALIESHGGSTGGGGGKGRGRAENNLSLAETLEQVLKNKTLRVNDAAEAVKAAGYKSNAANFRTMVNLQLIKSGKFKRVGRGQYTVA